MNSDIKKQRQKLVEMRIRIAAVSLKNTAGTLDELLKRSKETTERLLEFSEQLNKIADGIRNERTDGEDDRREND